MKKFLRLFSVLISIFLLEGVFSRLKNTNYSVRRPKNCTPVSFSSSPIYQDIENHSSKNFFFLLFCIGACVMLLYIGISKYSGYLQSNTFKNQNVEFIGTEFPVKKVPNWVALTDAERKMHYNNIPSHKIIPIPEYNVTDFQAGKVWKPDNEKQRNAYITYPVPNLGNYKLDGREGVGSHPGIDVKVPEGTPIYAFASGIVAKVEYQKTGFGKFVLIAHPNFPNPKNSQEKILIYSTYAHLSSQLVKEGDVVKKGQLIGKSGNSGMTTAPHLHFQLETEDAPFHPYWPFTWSDLNSSGISSYFGAVNSGFKKSNAEKYTFHPITLDTFANNFLASSFKQEVITEIDEKNPEKIEEEKEEIVVVNEESEQKLKIDTSTTLSETKIIPKTLSSAPDENITIITDRIFIPGKNKTLKVKASNEILLASAGIDLSSTLRGNIDISPKTLSKEDFDSDGIAEVTINTDQAKVFKVIATTDFGEVKSQSLLPQVFTDVPRNHDEVKAITYLKEQGIVRGYDDGTFKPDNNLSRSEAVKILMEANSFQLLSNMPEFSDVNTNDWFKPYVVTAFENGILKGYSDGTFGPHKKISRAEFLKVALVAAGIEVNDSNIVNYPDVPEDAWFSNYFKYAKERKLILPKKGGFISPHQPITRSEAARIIWMLQS